MKCFRLLLWDCDDRSYSFYIEVSTDQLKWTQIVDKRHDACKLVYFLTKFIIHVFKICSKM